MGGTATALANVVGQCDTVFGFWLAGIQRRPLAVLMFSAEVVPGVVLFLEVKKERTADA